MMEERTRRQVGGEFKQGTRGWLGETEGLRVRMDGHRRRVWMRGGVGGEHWSIMRVRLNLINVVK